MDKNKKTLNIIIADGSSSESYVAYLGLRFNINVIPLENPEKIKPDLVLFTGGADVNPVHYGEKVGKFTGIQDKRDNVEMDTFYRYRTTPKLGICRGSQLLTVLAGGKLVQHISGHTQNHNIDIEGFGTFKATSTHHQMMYPYDLPDNTYILRGWSSNFLSDTYLNGLNEEIKLSNNFLEAEIVEYKNTKSLCIQGHPEFGETAFQQVTLDLISDFLDAGYKSQYDSHEHLRHRPISEKDQDYEINDFETRINTNAERTKESLQWLDMSLGKRPFDSVVFGTGRISDVSRTEKFEISGKPQQYGRLEPNTVEKAIQALKFRK